MKRLSVVFLLSLLPLSLFAQADPIVTAITPASGPDSGGTEVTIFGDNLLPAIVCAVPCPTTVTFGTTTVEVTEESKTRLVVVTPPQAAGTVDVRVNVSGEEPVRLPGAFTFVGGLNAVYEAVLLPVYVEETAPGAHGSEWQTDFWIRNNGEGNVQLAPWPCPPNMACPPVYPLTHTLLPGLSIHDLPAAYSPASPNPSRVLYVSRPQAKDVSFSLRIADISRATLNAGTDLPVVRESELLREGSAQLLNVPLKSDFRVLLRVYDLALTSSAFRISVYPQTASDEPALITAAVVATTTQMGDFRTEAAYAQYDVTQLLQLDHVQWPDAVRLEVTPLNGGSRFWAFASITNNATQMVTLVTPQ